MFDCGGLPQNIPTPSLKRTAKAPEKGPLAPLEIPIGNHHFQGPC